MSSITLIRLGGLAAILAGILRGIASFIPGAVPVAPLETLYFFTDVFILFGLMGLYAVQHEESGWWGFFGFVLASVGIGSIIGPDATISGINFYVVGASVFAIGLGALAIGSWRANILPRWTSGLWMLSTIFGFTGFFAPILHPLLVISGVMFGVGFARAGLKVWRKRIVSKIRGGVSLTGPGLSRKMWGRKIRPCRLSAIFLPGIFLLPLIFERIRENNDQGFY